MSLKIKVFFDFVCPFCYLEYFSLKEAAQGMDVFFERIPHELRRPPSPMVDPMHDEARLKRFDEVLLPAAKALGLPMQLPRLSPHPYSTDTFLGLLYCEDHGVGQEYTEKVFTTFYEDEKDIGDLNVLEHIAKELGLNPQEFIEEITSKSQLARLDELNALSEEYKITSIPVIYIGDTKLSGYHTPDVYRQAITDALLQQEIAPVSGMSCGLDGNCGF